MTTTCQDTSESRGLGTRFTEDVIRGPKRDFRLNEFVGPSFVGPNDPVNCEGPVESQ